MVELDLVALVSAPVERELASLSESLRAPVVAANVRLLVGVDALMFFPVLVESELFAAVPAGESLHPRMHQHVASQREFRRENAIAFFARIDAGFGH